MEPRTRKELLQYAKKELLEAGIADAEVDSWILLEKYAGISRSQYYVEPEAVPSEGERRQFLLAVEERKKHVPLQQITGEQEFMGLSFLVTKDVLVPRQDTELLVEEALFHAEGKRILDVCTGSGCIILSLEKLGKPSVCVGLDISQAALRVASKNAKRLGCGKTQFMKSDLFSALSKKEPSEQKFDMIVSNPPYIESSVIPTLSEEVRLHEPLLALDGGEDGLCFYRAIAKEGGRYLVPGGRIFLEIGWNQGKAVQKILEENGYIEVQIKKDYGGNDRVAKAVFMGTEEA